MSNSWRPEPYHFFNLHFPMNKLSIFEEVVVEISKCPEKSGQLFLFAN